MKKIFGIFSFCLVYFAFLLAAIKLFLRNWQSGLLFTLWIIFSSIIIFIMCCSKCTAKAKCSHVLPGLIGKIRPCKSAKKYGIKEFTAILIGFGSITGVSQLILFDNPILTIIFWSQIVTGGLFIILKICPTCENKCCPISEKLKKDGSDTQISSIK